MRGDLLAAPLGDVAVEHGPEGGGRRRTELDVVDRGRVGLELDLDAGAHLDVLPVAEGERVGDARGIDRPLDHQAHAGVGGGVVEAADERVDPHAVAPVAAGGEVLGLMAVDREAQPAHEPDVGAVDAVDGRAADAAVGRRPGLRGRPQDRQRVVQQWLEWCGHVVLASGS